MNMVLKTIIYRDTIEEKRESKTVALSSCFSKDAEGSLGC